MTTEGGGSNVLAWSPRIEDGDLELFYDRDDKSVFAVTVGTGRMPRLSRPEQLPGLSEALQEAVEWPSFGPSPLTDGRWLALLKGEDEKPRREFRVVLNWTEVLKASLESSSR